MADFRHDPVQRPPGPKSAPVAGPAHTGERPLQHRCKRLPSRWSRFHLAEQLQPSQPCCNIDQQWRHLHHQQQQRLFSVGHFGWSTDKSSRGRTPFPRRHINSSSHRESSPHTTSDLPQQRGAQNGSTLITEADPMFACPLSGVHQHGTTHPQPDAAGTRALPGARQRWRSWTEFTSGTLAESYWKALRDHGR